MRIKLSDMYKIEWQSEKKVLLLIDIAYLRLFSFNYKWQRYDIASEL